MARLAVIGLGYVGLSVFAAFREAGRDAVGYDIDRKRIDEIAAGIDAGDQIPGEVVRRLGPHVTTDIEQLAECREWIVIVQTGLTEESRPDTSAVLDAASTIATMIHPGDLVVLSSTVPIGFTEGPFRSALEAETGLIAGEDFDLAFAPERFDPGNRVNTLRSIAKIVAGHDSRALARVRDLYRPVADEIVAAGSIRTAEASRVIENAQRDLNIAFVNDVTRLLEAWDIDTGDLLAVAGSKWNFLPFRPGLVGGHCIAVHPHFLIEAANQKGLEVPISEMARRVNDDLPERIARDCLERLSRRAVPPPATVTILGVAYKEDVPDVRGSRVAELARRFAELGCRVQLVDPLVRADDLERAHGLDLTQPDRSEPADAVVLAVAHRAYVEAGWGAVLPHLRQGSGIVVDLRRVLPRDTIPDGVELRRL